MTSRSSRARRVFFACCLIVALPASPFGYTAVVNMIDLHRFAKQLDQVDGLFSGYFEVLAQGSEIYVRGNGPYCSYRATKVYRHYAKEHENLAIISNAEAIDYKSAKKRSDGKNVEVTTFSSGLNDGITIEDGGYPAGFYPKCW